MSENPLKQLELAKKLAGSTYDRQQLRRALMEEAKRECEAARLYEPLAYQTAFHASKTPTVLVQKGNRTGATLSLMVEIVRAITGTDPYGKYPKQDGKAVILVYGEKHVGRVVYNGLFKSGHFKGFRLIKDRTTGKWRSYRPWREAEGGDLEREHESVPHTPLLPRRYLDGPIAWEKKAERVFSLIRLTNGWELYAANSAGDPGQFQGISINLYAIDEDMAQGGWYEEAQGRVTDVGGLIRWTALPHAKNDDMSEVVALAEKQAGLPNPQAEIIRATIFDNKFLSDEHREKSVTSWKSMGEDVYRKRVLGEISLTSVLMYPTFNRRTHDVMNSPTLEDDQRLLRERNDVPPLDWDAPRILAARNGQPPDDWTKYVSIDPGYNICAIEFLAVPPIELGEFVFVYDEVYMHEAVAWHFGEAMQERCGSDVFESFIFDFHGGRLRSIGTGDVPIEKYQEELSRRQIKSSSTGANFTPGCSDRKFREEVMRTYLAVRRGGLPKLMVVAAKCPSFCREMEKFRKKIIKQRGKDIPIDDGDRRAGTHAIEAVEQAIANDLSWVKPKPKAINSSWFDDRLTWGKRQQQRIDRGNRILGGPRFISLGPNGDSK